MATKQESKFLLNINYLQLVLDQQDAFEVMKLLQKAEVYERKYGDPEQEALIKPLKTDAVTLQVFPDELYKTCKLVEFLKS